MVIFHMTFFFNSDDPLKMIYLHVLLIFRMSRASIRQKIFILEHNTKQLISLHFGVKRGKKVVFHSLFTCTAQLPSG